MKIFLRTKDNKKIAANLFEPGKKQQPIPAGWLLLIHMMPATKESWNKFAEKLLSIGYESFAIDLRGHGESDAGPEGYLKFSNLEHQSGILDLEAGVEFLKSRGAVAEKIFLIGASIGANLSLQYITEHPEIKKVVLLSAGLNYRGVATEPLVKVLKSDQRIFLVSAKDDGLPNGQVGLPAGRQDAQANAVQNQKLYEAIPVGVQKEIKIYETGGHGTDLLQNQPNLSDLIIEFLNK